MALENWRRDVLQPVGVNQIVGVAECQHFADGSLDSDVADAGNNLIRSFNISSSIMSTLAGGGAPGGTAAGCADGVGNAALFTGRKLKFDPAARQFIGDDTANAMLTRELRQPWSLSKI